jgi:pimeloyl-ACP methyl ester carboxylesterase
MPVYWQMYEDYFANMKRLYIPDVVKSLSIPMLIIHGTADETVPYQSAVELKEWKPDAELLLLEGANHIFGAQHPWTEDGMPADLNKAISETVHFFKLQ